ncbi:hypothetical protein BCE02nite_23720 [Brevibacillus centrosporus]|nr:hypothetical protein BCE02nite_23720 [Brevibacillus centrosporus]
MNDTSINEKRAYPKKRVATHILNTGKYDWNHEKGYQPRFLFEENRGALHSYSTHFPMWNG